ncbi:MAG: hypothetical protein ABI542_09885 [Gemmatimonadota bacterium]
MTAVAGRRLGQVALLALAIFPGRAPAQNPGVRAALAQWGDSLAAVTEVATVRQLRTAAIAAADTSHGESVRVIRLALVELRLADLTDNGKLYGAAASALRGVQEDHPDWPVAGSLYALANLREDRTEGAFAYTMRAMMGFDPAKPLVEAFIRGTGPDSSYGDGLVQLGGWAINAQDDVVVEVALRALRAASPRVVILHPEVALWRSRIERLAGDPDSALAAIEFAARVHPDDPQILRVQGLLRFVYGRGDGAGPWFRGLEHATGAALSSYLHDLELVVPDSIRLRLPDLAGPARSQLMRDFWSGQDLDGLPSAVERLAEHYRRVDFAWANYVRGTVLDSLRRHKGVVLRDTLPVTALDARGRIMLLHGSPASRTSIGNSGGPEVDHTLGIIGMPENESWRYDDDRLGELLYHFYVPIGQRDFIAAESIFDILASTRQFNMFRKDTDRPLTADSARVTVQTYGAELVSGVAQELLRSRMPDSPVYAAMLVGGKRTADSLQAVERDIGRTALALPSTYQLGFELELAAAIDILTIGSDADGPLLQVAFAIPGGGLTARRLHTGVVYPIRMRVAVLDSTGRLVVQVDTTRGFVAPATLRPGQFLLGQLPIKVAPGTYRVRVALEADRRGTLTPSTVVTIADPARGRPTLSDLSIGERSVGILWRASTADTAWSDPRHTFAREREMQLYFEADGLAPGSSYTVDLAIDRQAKGAPTCTAAGAMLTLRFDQHAADGVNRFQRGVSLRRLQPGAYTLGVTITSADGQTARRCRSFTVTE